MFGRGVHGTFESGTHLHFEPCLKTCLCIPVIYRHQNVLLSSAQFSIVMLLQRWFNLTERNEQNLELQWIFSEIGLNLNWVWPEIFSAFFEVCSQNLSLKMHSFGFSYLIKSFTEITE